MAVVWSFPAAVDWLVANIRALPEAASPVVVDDGWPTSRGDKAIVIGITPEDPETEQEGSFAEVGNGMEWEEVTIPCILWARVGGGPEAMKPARDAAYALFNAIGTLMRTNAGRTLGGALTSYHAAIRTVRTYQTGAADQAGEGRRCEIRFNIVYRNRF